MGLENLLCTCDVCAVQNKGDFLSSLEETTEKAAHANPRHLRENMKKAREERLQTSHLGTEHTDVSP